MVPIFNLRGFIAVDPLDRAPAAMRFVLAIAVSGALAFAFLYTQSAALNVTTFPSQSVMWIGIAIYAFVMAPLLVVLRKSSSLLFYLMIVSVCVPVDIFRQAHYPEGWWVYQPGSFLSPIPVPLKFTGSVARAFGRVGDVSREQVAPRANHGATRGTVPDRMD
jgi:hypothetical protein